MTTRSDTDERLAQLAASGVVIRDPRTTYVAPDVDLARIRPGVVLHPGARVEGARTYLGEGAEIGRSGPAVVRDAAIGPGARVDGGCVEGSVLLDGAIVGPSSHVRPASLLEEQASIAHATGLKHTILLAFVTVGSVVNFCDVLMAGGTSRKDHSEVGSGFIHFNFTPWGEHGDKATPSLVGDVPHGVFLRSRRIFLGGAGGLVGPGQVGYGAVTGAGQVVRRPVAPDTLHIEGTRSRSVALADRPPPDLGPKTERNVVYVANLVALRAFYRDVRRRRADEAQRPLIDAAIDVLDAAIEERRRRLDAFLASWDAPPVEIDTDVECPPCPLPVDTGPAAHVDWVRALAPDAVEAGVAWLTAIVERVTSSVGRR
ncbi:MAG: UDP-N-acetylglucosamine pyrophosphorylase [Deltaproteobacteria bacterium]|nr:MAG: UDP-N-acetylglucosamine pyrophosphorylase [Deltaproteobacteria bacterium]